MEDYAIVSLYWLRNPDAIRESGRKYGAYCKKIAWNILRDGRDAEECVNDTWLNAWNAMPEDRPDRLGPFLGKITRNLAFNRWRSGHAEKRGGGELPAVLEELAESVCGGSDLQETMEAAELAAAVNRFLRTLAERERTMFLRRYWFAEPIADIARRYGIRENTVRSRLFRIREKLRRHLEKEGLL